VLFTLLPAKDGVAPKSLINRKNDSLLNYPLGFFSILPALDYVII